MSKSEETAVTVGDVAKADLVNIHYPGVEGHKGTDMKISEAIDSLKQRQQYLAQATVVNETFNAFPWDGAHALDKVMTRTFGWTAGKKVVTWFGENPPNLVKIEVGPGEYASVPWGRVLIPNCEGGYMDMGLDKGADGMIKFKLAARVLRRDEGLVSNIFKDIRDYLRDHSIYRGQAIKIAFTDDDGEVIEMPQPEFMDMKKIDPRQLILPRDVMEMVQTNIYIPIERWRDVLANGVAFKRGVLLSGKFGTGKTLAAMIASYYAVRANATFMYLSKTADLAKAIAFCKQYQTDDSVAVIFAEDIDREASGGRTAELDKLLNIVDGVDSKRWNIMTVLTTNDVESINAAMVRPGRLDAIIEVAPPDADAVERLLRHYCGDALSPDEDLAEVGLELEGCIPAVVAETAKRAQLYQIGQQEPGTKITKLTAQALLLSARTQRRQIDLLEKLSQKVEVVPSVDKAFGALMARASDGHYDDVKHTVQ